MAARVLHLVGSPDSEFLEDVSRAYARDCFEANESVGLTDQFVAHVARGGEWTFSSSPQSTRNVASAPLREAEALDYIGGLAIDVVLPHMFCVPGVTHYRQLLLDAGLPVVGNLPGVMAIAADKWATREAVARAGVRVPAGERIGSTGRCSLRFPVVVKPATADNSSGVSLVRDASNMPAALTRASEHSGTVFAEEYIPAGREVRCGVLETDEGLVPLPLQEYAIDEQTHPIRGVGDKLVTTESGRVDLASKHGSRPWIVDGTDPATAAVQRAALECYSALGCRHYGLFDFRIDPAGAPWLLEAGLYCSFAPKSVLVMMAAADGISREAFLGSMIERARQPELCREVT